MINLSTKDTELILQVDENSSLSITSSRRGMVAKCVLLLHYSKDNQEYTF